MKQVYDYYTKKVVFEGTYEQCWDWIMSQAFTFKDGRKIFRSWLERGSTVYDVGNLYIFNS